MDKKGRNILIAACWLLLWQLLSMAVGSELLLPSPWRTLTELVRLLGTGGFYATAGMTILRVAGGFLLGMLAGTLLGVLTAVSRYAEAFLAPLRTVVKATPVSSFIMLVLLYMTNSLTPLFISFLMVTPIAWINTQQGVRAVDGQLVEMARVYKLGLWARLRCVYFPSILPQYTAACVMGWGFAWKSGIAAEVIARPAFSIGRSIYESKIYVETPALFAWTAAVVLLSVLLEKVMLRLFANVEGKGMRRCALPVRPAPRASAGGAPVTLAHVSVAFGEKTVLQDLNATLPVRGTVAILGPSGSGKTTLLRLLAGLQTATGAVRGLDGLRVAVVFQEDRLLPWLTARQNVLLACGDAAVADSWLAAMELDAPDKLPRELSGGMQRRVALARALAFGGDMLLLDEPFKGLDDALKARVAARMREVFPCCVVATHDLREAEALGLTQRIQL